MLEFDGVDRKTLPPLYEPIAPPTFRHIPQSICPFCNRRLGEDNWSIIDQGRQYTMACPVCGFTFEHLLEYHVSLAFPSNHRFFVATLRQFHLSDAEVTMEELGSHLRRRFKDVYSLSPRRFEFLVADLFRNQGFAVRLTKASRDGGYDIHLLEKNSGEQILVECKRYREARKVGVTLVRQLLGVQVREGVRRAKFVTTSGFTQGVEKEVCQAQAMSGFNVELLDANDLAEALAVYNTALPPLHLHPLLREK